MLRVEVLGVEFDPISLENAIGLGASWCEDKDKRACHYVVTPNPEFILMAQKDDSFRQILNGANLVLPDGIGVIYASKLLGTPLDSRVPGIDFAWGLLAHLNSSGGKLFLLGAKEGVAEKAKEKLTEQYPSLNVVGVHHGYFKEDRDEEVAKIIADSGADVLFICLGAPRQEKFLAQWGEKAGILVGVGLGGALDVFAGNVERAPESWQKMNLEWLYRLKKEPQRFGRMAKLPLVLVQATKQRVFGKKKK